MSKDKDKSTGKPKKSSLDRKGMSRSDWGHPRWYEWIEAEEKAAGRNYGSGYKYKLYQHGFYEPIPPGDRERAALRVLQLDRVIEEGMWTKKENGRLWAMRKKWQQRAEGKNAYFEKYGTYSPKKGQQSPSSEEEKCPPQCFMCYLLSPTRYPGRGMWDALIRETDEKCTKVWI